MNSIFTFLYEKYKIKYPLLIELFAGYGSQALALKYLGVKFKHHKICEWATKSIQAYNDLHLQDYTDYSHLLSDKEIFQKLADLGVSFDYNKPMTIQEITRRGGNWARNVYNNIIATNNLVDISKVKGIDLDFDKEDLKEHDVIVTYSFPCQDLSNSGKKRGMAKENNTRSGLLWQVERILQERKNDGLPLPTVLLMENVPDICNERNIEHFKSWQIFLEKLGYTNYISILNASDFAIPQNRNRCFMISVLGEFAYNFPDKLPLETRLKDIIEKNVDEKYYLSEKQLAAIVNWNAYQKPLETMEQTNNSGVSPTITTRSGAYAAGMILIKEVLTIGNYSPSGHNAARVVDPEGIAPTVMENHGTVTAIPIKNATKKGYLLAEDGDGVDISGRMKYHRGTVQKGITQTITTKPSIGFCESKVVGGVGDKKSIRKLTPKESFKLMGVKSEDYEKIEKNQNESSLYHLAGDSIVVSVLMALFGTLFDVDYKEKIKYLVNNLKGEQK